MLDIIPMKTNIKKRDKISFLEYFNSSRVDSINSMIFSRIVLFFLLERRITCIVNVLPPLTIFPWDKFCLVALNSEIGLKPGW